MSRSPLRKRRVALLIWAGLTLIMLGPIAIAATSPFLAYRTAVHIVGGFAGIICLALLLIQPLLAAGWLPGVGLPQACRWHRWVGAAIVIAVLLHVGFLFATSPVDMLDALLLVAPTPFSVYGVISMWCIGVTAGLATARHVLKLPYGPWRLVHSMLAVVIVGTAAAHAFLIEGAMGANSKLALIIVMLMVVTAAAPEMNLLRPYRQRRALQER